MMPAKFRMIAIDFDGTLLCGKGTVTPRTRAAVHSALSAGMLICFATGRSWTECKAVVEAVDHYGAAVVGGGSMVVDTRDQRTLHRWLMPPELARQVCEFFEKKGQAALALQDKNGAGVDYLTSGKIELSASSVRWISITGTRHDRVPQLSAHPHEHTLRVSVVAPADVASQLVLELTETFGDRIFFHCINVMSEAMAVIEVFDRAVNKWEGVLRVAAEHGIEPQEIIAIGDDMNDLPMIQNAGLGVAMGNAPPQVRAAAKRVIGSNREEGLAQFLEELVGVEKCTSRPGSR